MNPERMTAGALLAVCVLLLGCPGRTNPPADASGDGTDALTDSAGDGGLTVAPVTDPVPLPINEWRYAEVLTTGASDLVNAALEDGTFSYPDAGSAYGVAWDGYVPSDLGEFPRPLRNGLMYAAAQIDVPAGVHVFARADTVIGVYGADGSRQPGDLYGSGTLREPLITHPGTNLIVARGFLSRSDPQVQLWTTPDEVVFNLADTTVPDPVAGDSSEQWIGVPVLNVTDAPILDLVARVEQSAAFEATAETYPGLAAGSVSQIAFRLSPRGGYPAAGTELRVGLRVESPSLHFMYRREVTLTTVAPGVAYRRTFRSSIDRSAQYYAVLPPSAFDPARNYALVLSLHGASVQAIGQAQAYSARDWNYLVAPTNRRPYGFDWEAWGRLDGIEVLDQAMSTFHIAPDQVYLVGHSMGGHGTYQLGVLFPGRFATIGPSAGWVSFQTYQNIPLPTGAFARSQASSNTLAYVSNLAHRGAYVIHGSADDNVPVTESRNMVPILEMYTSDVVYHEQPGAGHWWDGDAAPGADCVDWLPLFDFMHTHRLDPTETDFRFTTPGPWVNARHSFVTVRSAADAYQDCVVQSARTADSVAITTTNVRSLAIDGSALRAKGIAHLTVDGTSFEIIDGPIAVGPQTGKHPGAHGPLNDVMARAWCYVYPDDGPVAYRRYAALLASSWNTIGNGAACTLPLSRVTPAIRAAFDLVYLGVPAAALPALPMPFHWDAQGAALDTTRYDGSALMFVFPEGDRVSALFAAPAGEEYLLFRIQPFTSSFALPDYYVWNRMGRQAAGFFTGAWEYQAGR